MSVCHCLACQRLVASRYSPYVGVRGLALAVVCLLAMYLAGCQLVGTVAAKRPYETVVADKYHDLEEAEELTRRAHQAMATSHWGKAESLLREALVADVNYGPAHNSLGWLYYQQQQLYLAAWEFEYAARLMPELPEPLNNQGLVLEAAGRFVEALARYEDALALGPEHPETIANLARCLVRLDGQEEGFELRSAEMLREVAYRDQRPDWREWARELLATRYADCNELLAGGTLACPVDLNSTPVLLPDTFPLSLPPAIYDVSSDGFPELNAMPSLVEPILSDRVEVESTESPQAETLSIESLAPSHRLPVPSEPADVDSQLPFDGLAAPQAGTDDVWQLVEPDDAP